MFGCPPRHTPAPGGGWSCFRWQSPTCSLTPRRCRAGRNTSPVRVNGLAGWVQNRMSRFCNTACRTVHETGGHECQTNSGGLHQPDPVPVHRRRLGRDRLLRFGVRRQARRPDGRSTASVAHAELDFGNGRLQLSDPKEAYQIAAPDPKAFATHSVALYCQDVDEVVDTSRAGRRHHPRTRPDLRHRRPVRVDPRPFGQRWTVMTRVEDVSPEERDRRMAEWAKENI